MAACPHCGGHAHLDSPCAALAPVRSALRFPGAFRVGPGGRELFARTVNSSSARVAGTAFLVAASFGALLAAHDGTGLALTGAFGLAAAIALALVGGKSQAVRVTPGLLERFGEHGVSGLPLRLTAEEVSSIDVRPAPDGFVISAFDRAQPVPLLSGVRSKSVAESLAVEIRRVFLEEPFVGERPLELERLSAAPAKVVQLYALELRDHELILVRNRKVRLDSDQFVGADVIESISSPNAAPRYILQLRTRKGETLRPIGPLRQASGLACFVQQLRYFWKL